MDTMDMNLDNSPLEVHSCNRPGCDIGFRGEEECELYIRPQNWEERDSAPPVPYPTSWIEEDTPDISNQSQPSVKNDHIRDERRAFQDRGHRRFPRSSRRDCYDVLNDGNQNDTYNNSQVYRNRRYKRSRNSAMVNVYLYDQVGGTQQERSPSARVAPISPSNHRAARPFSQDTPAYPVPTLPTEGSYDQNPPRSSPLACRNPGSPSTSHLHDTVIDCEPTPSYEQDSLQQNKEKNQTRTPSERYESLLLRCKLGFPLWRPSPRCTPSGKYIPDIGDVGVLTHDLPFNTLFSVTQSRNSPANRDGIPEGVDPPCVLNPRSIDVNQEYHPPKAAFVQPQDAISRQNHDPAGDASSIFNFHLTGAAGALLMLPQGGKLHTLVATTEFKRRVRLYWRQWYEFAADRVDLDEGQALYLVTGFERCSTWAMAVWDSTTSHDHDETSSLKLSVVESTGACSWAFPPARCTTQSSSTSASGSVPCEDQQTVFIRGFWIDRFDGSISSRSPVLLSSPPGQGKDDNSNNSNSRGSSSHDPPSNPPSSAYPSFYGGGSGASNFQSDFLDPSIDKLQTKELELNLSISDGGEGSDDIAHPCKIINMFALELISKVKPALLDAGCVAFSHDEDWISIIRDSDEDFPSNFEIVQRICSQYKFTIEGDVIYTASMTDTEKEFLEKRETSRFQRQDSMIPVLVVFTVSPTTDALVSQPITSTSHNDRLMQWLNNTSSSLTLEEVAGTIVQDKVEVEVDLKEGLGLLSVEDFRYGLSSTSSSSSESRTCSTYLDYREPHGLTFTQSQSPGSSDRDPHNSPQVSAPTSTYVAPSDSKRGRPPTLGVDISLAEAESRLRRIHNFRPEVPLALSSIPDPPPSDMQLDTLVQIAIWSSPQRRLLASEIYAAIEERFRSFSGVANQLWRRSVRHMLSFKQAYVKSRDKDHSGHRFWQLDYDHLDHGYKRERKRGSGNSRTPGKKAQKTREDSPDSYVPSSSRTAHPIQLSTAKNLSHIPCKFFKVGSCTAGSSCPFSHSAPEPGAQKDACAWFVKGNCKFGHKCALAHVLPGQSMSMDRKNKKAAQVAAGGGRYDSKSSGRAGRRDTQVGRSPALISSLKASITPSAPAPAVKDTDFASLGVLDENSKLLSASAHGIQPSTS
ncbi:hypothetical protein PM082_015682 [Marasmius tenuissimus]|nr:hypothetical protein PM082_015682 [Marasmius tenuissimus]